MGNYVYIRSEPGLWTVGHYTPAGAWVPESDYGDADTAAARVAWLNGATPPSTPAPAPRSPDKAQDPFTEPRPPGMPPYHLRPWDERLGLKHRRLLGVLQGWCCGSAQAKEKDDKP